MLRYHTGSCGRTAGRGPNWTGYSPPGGGRAWDLASTFSAAVKRLNSSHSSFSKAPPSTLLGLAYLQQKIIGWWDQLLQRAICSNYQLSSEFNHKSVPMALFIYIAIHFYMCSTVVRLSLHGKDALRKKPWTEDVHAIPLKRYVFNKPVMAVQINKQLSLIWNVYIFWESSMNSAYMIENVNPGRRHLRQESLLSSIAENRLFSFAFSRRSIKLWSNRQRFWSFLVSPD